MFEQLLMSIVPAAILTISGVIGWLINRDVNRTVGSIRELIELSSKDREEKHTIVVEDIREMNADIKELSERVGVQNGRTRSIEEWITGHEKLGKILLENGQQQLSELKQQVDLLNEKVSHLIKPRAAENFRRIKQ